LRRDAASDAGSAAIDPSACLSRRTIVTKGQSPSLG
jgi:hypothetical protein